MRKVADDPSGDGESQGGDLHSRCRIEDRRTGMRDGITGGALRVGRRAFIRLAAATGIALPGLSAILAACDADRPDAAERSDDGGRPNVKLLATTPPMGWNSWNVYGEDIDETKILAIANAIVDSGMRDAGWEYVMLDDGWQRVRGSRFSYELDYDPGKFPRGIKFLADYVHERGMKLGIYSGPGAETCAGYTGSAGHEMEDAQLFASWGGGPPQVRLMLLARQRRGWSLRDAQEDGGRTEGHRPRHRAARVPLRVGRRVGMGAGRRRASLAHRTRHHRRLRRARSSGGLLLRRP